MFSAKAGEGIGRAGIGEGAAGFEAGAHPHWGSLNLYADADTLGLDTIEDTQTLLPSTDEPVDGEA